MVRTGDRRGACDGNRRIIMNWIFEKWDGGIDWINMDQDRKGKREYVNAVINRRIP